MVSILLCTYNREKLIRETIESILAQTYEDFELVIVDDGSTDGTREVLEEYREKDQRIRLIFQEKNKFYCRSANDGLRQVAGDYVAYATSDDTWHPEKLQKQMAYLEEHPECGACFTYADVIDENGESAEKDFPDIAELLKKNCDTREDWMRYFFRDGNCIAHPSAVLPRHIVEKVGGFHLLFCQGADLDMWIRVLMQAPIYVLPESLTYYRCHRNPENQISGASRLKTARFVNEHMLMRKKMMRMLNDEELVRYFGVDFKKKDARTHLELEIERAFLLAECVKGLPDMYVLGIEKFEEILDQYQEEAVEVLEKEYHTTLQDLYRMNLHHFYVDFGIHEEKAEQATAQQALLADIHRCQEEKMQILYDFNSIQNEKAKLLREREQLQKKVQTLEKEKKDIQSEADQTRSKLNLKEAENYQIRRTLEKQVLENLKLQETKSGKRKQL